MQRRPIPKFGPKTTQHKQDVAMQQRIFALERQLAKEQEKYKKDVVLAREVSTGDALERMQQKMLELIQVADDPTGKATDLQALADRVRDLPAKWGSRTPAQRRVDELQNKLLALRETENKLRNYIKFRQGTKPAPGGATIQALQNIREMEQGVRPTDKPDVRPSRISELSTELQSWKNAVGSLEDTTTRRRIRSLQKREAEKLAPHLKQQKLANLKFALETEALRPELIDNQLDDIERNKEAGWFIKSYSEAQKKRISDLNKRKEDSLQQQESLRAQIRELEAQVPETETFYNAFLGINAGREYYYA